MEAAKKKSYILANFGGPRSLSEIESFLKALLTDREVIRNSWPAPMHHLFFSWIAKKRASKVLPEYQSLGGCSPIYNDTERMADILRTNFHPLFTFHRYLPNTHATFIQEIGNLDCDEIDIFPMFPQFSYSTTGSIATWFKKSLPRAIVNKMRWIKSYSGHPSFVVAHQKLIRQFLHEYKLKDEETVLLFSAHGLPQKFIDTGDIYQSECQISVQAVMESFSKTLGRLSYQSRFGKEEWIKPYTIDVCKSINIWAKNRKNVVFIPISFTSDHIETLCEIEKEYMPEVRENGLKAYRMPCLNFSPEWINAIETILKEKNFCSNDMLVRKGQRTIRTLRTIRTEIKKFVRFSPYRP